MKLKIWIVSRSYPTKLTHLSSADNLRLNNSVIRSLMEERRRFNHQSCKTIKIQYMYVQTNIQMLISLMITNLQNGAIRNGE